MNRTTSPPKAFTPPAGGSSVKPPVHKTILKLDLSDSTDRTLISLTGCLLQLQVALQAGSIRKAQRHADEALTMIRQLNAQKGQAA